MNTGAWDLLDPEGRFALIRIIDAAKGPDLVARVAATGDVTAEEIEREIADRNMRHERWLRTQQA